MAVYVDESVWPFRGQLYCHMLADTIEELHAMADKIGMKRAWFQSPPKIRTPHYDIAPSRRALAVKYGAIEVDKYQMNEIAKKAREVWKAHMAQTTGLPSTPS